MPAVPGLGWWQTPTDWPPVEILFQRQLPTGTSVRVPTPALCSLRWFILAADQVSTRRSLQPGIGGGTAQGLTAQPHRCQPRAVKPAPPSSRAGPSSLRQRPQPVRTERPPSSRGGTYVTSVGAVVCRLRWQARKRARFFAARRRGRPGRACVAARAGEHPLALRSLQRQPALRRSPGSGVCAVLYHHRLTKCYCR